MEQRLHVSTPADGVGQILIDAPPRNVPLPPLWLRFEAALEELRDGGTRVVVVGSRVEGFFIGHGSLEGIIRYFSGEETGGDTMAQPRVSRELDRGPMISIAAIDGQAWGGGAELAWACDLRVASEAATLAQPEVNIGLTPGFGGAAKVARLAGEAAALRLCLDGRPVPAAEAKELGLVHRVVPPGTALDAAVEWGTWLASRPAWALEANKRLIKSSRDVPLRDALRMELQIFSELASRPDTMDLVEAAQRRYDHGGDSHDAFTLPR